jgi:glucose-1-phosphate adenylyltransferase
MRAKPAVPIAGKYRLIDIPISNCINSGIHRIAILTQFNSVSLHRHIQQPTILTPSTRAGWRSWQPNRPHQLILVPGNRRCSPQTALRNQGNPRHYVLILAGDHLYRMDYAPMAKFHWENQADITVAVQPVSAKEAYRFGIFKAILKGRLTDFVEKPKAPEQLAKFSSRDDPERPFLGSMGIYLFKTSTLINCWKT